MKLRLPVVLGIGLLASLGEPGFAAPSDNYLRDIKPVLKERCYACHGALKQKADLRLDTVEQLLEGTTLDELVARIGTTDLDERMPPEGEPLKSGEIEAIKQWIAAGAPKPENELGDDDPAAHWAFQRIERPAIPESAFKNPIDAFLSEKRDAENLKPQPEAEREILLRRVYLDLIGLPPTAEQLADGRRFEVITDELLASSQHGERWARHWMDVWRYTDWYGLGAQLRNSQKHLWHWRDWIVESLNDDKGYDRMVQEMLAADELAPGDADAIRATGFLARNYFLFNRTTWLDSTVEHTGKAFFGLTMNCAKCHDHKYDPLSHEDYYRFRAVFEPHQIRLDPVPGVINFEKDGVPRAFDDQPEAVTFLHKKGDEKNPDKDLKIVAGVPAIFSKFEPKAIPVSLPVGEWAPGSRSVAQQDRIGAAEKRIESAEQAMKAARANFASAPKPTTAATSKAKAQVADFSLTDDFSKANPDVWEITGEGWKYENGTLRQTRSTRDSESVTTKIPLPRDFELRCRYTLTGGAVYKSVTFKFDLSDDLSFSNYVYTSGHAPGPKVQAAFTRGGKSSYPGEGRKVRKFEVGDTISLRFAVRDRLVNVWVDDEFQVAYEFPSRSAEPRKLALSGFDAEVAFDEILITALAPDVNLIAAKAKTAPEPEPGDLKKSVKTAEAKLTMAEAEASSLKATVAADRSKFSDAPNAALETTAAQLQAEFLKAKADFEIVANTGGDAKKLNAGKALLKKAIENLAAVKKGTLKYESLRASMKALEGPAHKEPDYPATYSPVSTGRRLALAKWATDRENPLTARVAVNHVWMRHFGEPIVPTVFDFGRQAPRPEHAALLDFLAAEFIESGWSFKKLHRLMVTSKAYQATASAAGADPATLAKDPNNHLLWRMNSRRMESQAVRDSLLHLAGELDLTLGGPSINPNSGGKRRSLYFLHSRDHADLMQSKFDEADILQCYRRAESIIPQQALALYNSKLAITMAAQIADSVEDSKFDAFAETVFETLLCRKPNFLEQQECHQFQDETRELAGESYDEKRMRAQFVLAILNHNDFVTIR
ncbi:MAG: PSD1 and planctomycete cytochrome C domain-containing protein [Verrucomicrobiales bacterium]